MGAVDTIEWARVLCGITFKMTEQVQQQICIKFCIKFEHAYAETIWMIQKATAVGNWRLAVSSQQHVCSCITSLAVLGGTITQVTQHPYSPDLVPCDFWLFPKLKSPLKGKRFQTIDEIQENMTGQLMVTGRTVWGPKVPILKRTEVLLSHVHCFLYLVSSSINLVFIVHFWILLGQTSYM